MALGPFLSNGGLEEPRQSRIERSRWTLVLDIGRLKRSAPGASEDRYGFAGPFSRCDSFAC
jgi:hypothetical protein